MRQSLFNGRPVTTSNQFPVTNAGNVSAMVDLDVNGLSQSVLLRWASHGYGEGTFLASATETGYFLNLKSGFTFNL
jgi:hypothetical protein